MLYQPHVAVLAPKSTRMEAHIKARSQKGVAAANSDEDEHGVFFIASMTVHLRLALVSIDSPRDARIDYCSKLLSIVSNSGQDGRGASTTGNL